jgi:membrane protease subunit (stomatin/prohibitin family)
MLRDPEFGPTRLRAFGTFAIRVSDTPVFLRQLVGTDGRFTIDEIGEQLRDLLTARFADALGEAKIPALDLAANQDEIGKVLIGRVNGDFAAMGLQVASLVVENISLPPEVEAALDKRTSMGVIGNLDAYAKFQAAQAMEKAAENPNGMAGMGAGMGAGFAMANQMGNAMSANTKAPRRSRRQLLRRHRRPTTRPVRTHRPPRPSRRRPTRARYPRLEARNAELDPGRAGRRIEKPLRRRAAAVAKCSLSGSSPARG